MTTERFMWTLAALLWGPGAIAQTNPCNVPLPNTPRAYADFDKTKPLVCAEPTLPTVRMNGAGIMAWRYCKGSRGYYPNWGAATWAHIGSTALGTDLIAAGVSASPTAVGALAVKHVTLPLAHASLTPVWCPFQAEMWAGVPALPPPPPPPPPPPAWIVASTLTYSVRNNSLSLVPGAAPVGAACNCAAPFVVGAFRYCTFTGATSSAVLARCRAP